GIDAGAFSIVLPSLWEFFDLFIEQRLGNGRVVDFTMTVAAVADDVDNNVALELVAIFHRDAPNANHRFGVFRVHVEDRDRLASRKIGREARGVKVLRLSGEANQIVADDVDGAPDRVTLQVGHVERLRPDAL